MTLEPWKLNAEQRWHITMTLKTASPLHIGSGELGQHFLIEKDTQGKETKIPVDINECIKGKNRLTANSSFPAYDNLPIIPGSSIKGTFLDWLNIRKKHENKTEFEALLANLFGKGYNDKTGYQGRAGKVEFHDAYITQELADGSIWPYWRKERQTFIDTSTALDRHSKTALYQSLHYTECVPSGVDFTFTFTGFMSEQEAGVLIAVLDSFYSLENQPYFGAENANGYGRMEYVGCLKVKAMGNKEIAHWLADFNKDKMPMAMDKAEPLKHEYKQQLIDQGKTLFKSGVSEQRIAITLKFDGPFLVNDPYKVIQLQTDPKNKTDHYPLLDTNKKPRLPNSSIRGALRSQAERIIRSLGGPCCDTRNPCKPIYEVNHVEKLCLACQIFGASGWKTVINIEEFSCQNDEASRKQEFVAIDRFHGGGMDGAKFDATVFESPVFTGAISFSPRMQECGLNWGRGLLALVLRDLHESDITFGFGANKGYGRLEKNASGINFEQFDESDIGAFRDKFEDMSALWQSWLYTDKWDMFLEAAQTWYCDEIQTPEDQGEKKPIVCCDNTATGFHNPYQFIPTQAPDTKHWLDKESGVDKLSPHSHGFYRTQTNDGKPLHHGRITCQLTTETPIFIGANKQADSEPAEINNYTLNGEIAIPATSLRGMISSLTEAASNSSMRVLDNGLLSFRKSADDALKKIGIVVEVGENRKKVIPIATTDKVIKLKNAYEPGEMMTFINDSQSWSTEHNQVYYYSSDNDIPEKTYSLGLKPGILRILGKDGRDQSQLENKKHELFIQVPLNFVDTELNLFKYDAYIKDQIKNNNAIILPDPVIKRYSDLADQRTLSQKSKKELKDDNGESVQWLPFHLKGTKRKRDKKHAIYNLKINKYDLIYYANNRSEITEISFSSIWRNRVEESAIKPSTVHNFVPDELCPFNNNRTKISPAELLFGFVELNHEETEKETSAYAGKVSISAGITCSENLVDENAPVVLKALSSPKLPSPSLYFKTKQGNSYIAKQELNTDEHKINGRKYYLHALQKDNKVQKLTSKGQCGKDGDSKFPWETQDKEKNPQLKVEIQPIRKEKCFKFHIDFNNLTDWELGLLCYALRPTDKFRHRLGMGKPIGLGTVKIDIEQIQYINRKQRYAEDGINDERYNQIREFSTEQIRKIFTDSMHADIYRALDLLGNPDNVNHPVHYPQVNNGDIELENFKWFIANDKGSGSNAKNNEIAAEEETMDSLNENMQALPILTRHPYNND